MKPEPKNSNTSDTDSKGFGWRAYAVIAGFIVLFIANTAFEIARVVNIVLNPGLFWEGAVRGFRAAFQAADGLLLKLVAPALAASVVLVMGGAIVLATVLAIASLRRSRARVFISYHRSMWDHVEALGSALKKSGIEPLVVPFQSDPEHDQLLDDIYALIERADFVVCLPGMRPSFVEHEVAAAVIRKKSLFILLPQQHAGAPNTAQHSYPVLSLDHLRTEHFKPLVQLLLYLHGNLSSTIRLYFTPTRLPTLAQAVGGAMGYAMLLVVAVYMFSAMFGKLRELFSLNADAEGYLLGMLVGATSVTIAAWLALAIAGNFAVGGITTVRNRALAIRQTRRLLKDGSYSYPILQSLFRPTTGLLELLDPFLHQAPPAYHQVEHRP